MTSKRIFVTGASGCIGHYIVEALLQETDHELFLLVRNPDKLKFDFQSRPNVTLLKSDMRDIEQYRDLLKTVDCAILVATAWGGDEVYEINVLKNLQLLSFLDPQVCEQVIYFSTESILDRQDQLLPEAEQFGSDYVKSKYICYQKLSELEIFPKITTLFPTLVFGGGDRYPYSHISAGIGDVVKWTKLIKFFHVDGSFHFVHGRDIAQVVRYLIDHPPDENQPRKLVLGSEKITVNQAIEEASDYLNERLYFRLPLHWLAEFFIFLFRIQVSEWDRFSMRYRHFTHPHPVSPATFGLPTYCATVYDLLKLSGISQGKLARRKL